MDEVRSTTKLDAEPTYAGVYSQRDLLVDGIIAMAAVAFVACVVAAILGKL